MKLPNFIGIGAPKSGTTWLARCLGEHPDIFMAPVKETEFWKFADAEQRLDDYAAHFKGAQNERAIGEFSVRYLSFPGVPERLKRSLPDVRLLASLRNPIDQVYSNYWHLQRQNFNLHDPSQAPRSIEEALEKHRDFLCAPARYADHLTRWLAQFPPQQLKIVLFDEIESCPAEVLRSLFGFLSVDPTFEPPSLAETGTDVRRGTSPRSASAARWHSKIYGALVQNVYTPMKRGLGTRRATQIKEALQVRPLMERLFMRKGYPPMSAETRALLAKEFEPEIEKLEKLTGLDLGEWRKGTTDYETTDNRTTRQRDNKTSPVVSGQVSSGPVVPPTRLAILATHPIQYYAPWFRHLATVFDLEVLYMHRQDPAGQSAAGFDVEFEWDVPLLEGYRYRWLKNVSRKPGLQTFGGCDTPEIADIIRGQRDDRTTPIMDREQADNETSPLVSSPVVSGQLSRGQRRFDALLVPGWNKKSFIQGIRAAWRNKVPVLARGDSQLTTERSLLKRAIKFLPYRWFLPRIDAHLYVGKRNREYLLHYGVQERQLFFSPHFVDNEFFRARAEKLKPERAEIRENWGIAPDAFVPLFVGKFIPRKRPLDLVKAAQLLLSSSSKLQAPSSLLAKLHLLFVGSGELGTELRANCNVVFDANQSVVRSPVVSGPVPVVSGRSPIASFTGFLNQTEIPKAYVAADVLVLPSCHETWGLVVNEAMACGIPAIVSDVTGCAPDLIDVDVTGWTFPMSDVTGLAQRIAHFRRCNSQDLRRKSESFSIEQATIGLTRAVASLLASKGRCHD
jgi:glycosyltransferase involved in cell wall biosynthesis